MDITRPSDFEPSGSFGPARERQNPFESERRHKCAKALEKYVKYSYEKFRLRGEHVAAIQLADMKQLVKGGRLWADDSNTVPSRMMKNRLNRISPFCRHYMLHLDPKNLTSSRWKHAVLEPLDNQPNPSNVPWDDGVKAYEKALSYHSRFQTRPDLQSIPLNEQQMEEAKCRGRNEDKCVVTGRSKPRVFWIIPSTWNDTVDHMNATGDLCPGCLALTSINLLKDPNLPQGPDLLKESSPPVSVKKLGTTHKSWNMMCIDPVLYKYLNDGWCAFKYLFHEEDDNDKENFKVTLEFHWMPKLIPRTGQEMDIEKDWAEFSWQMGQFDNCPPPPGLEHGKVKDKSGDLLKSGYCFDVLVPKQHIAQFQSGIEVHWACIQFTALCGAAGRPWLLSGMDPEDEAMQERQKKAISQDNQKMGGWGKTLSSRAKTARDTAKTKVVDAGRQVTDKLAGKLTGKSTGKVSRPPLPDFKPPSSAPGAPDPPGGPGGSE